MEQYPFQTTYHLISYYVWKNPARARYPNLLENEGSGAPPPQFSGAHPQDIYCSVIHAIRAAIKLAADSRAKQYFAEHMMGDPTLLKSKEQIAKEYGVHPRTVTRGINKILVELEREMVRRELIDPAALYNYNDKKPDAAAK